MDPHVAIVSCQLHVPYMSMCEHSLSTPNGLLIKTRTGNRKVTCISNVLREAHHNSDNSITDEFRKHGYSFQSQSIPGDMEG